MTFTEFCETYAPTSNPQQQEAMQAAEGAILLLAVPGSGKTTVLVDRLGYMVRCLGIAPESILTMTYTVAATREMKQRFCEKFGGGDAMEICTINSLSHRIIRYYAAQSGRGAPFELIREADAARIVGEIYRQFHREYPTESTVRDIRTGITYIKNQMLTPQEIAETDFGIDKLDLMYRAYCDRLRQERLMDFDDQMQYALTILRTYPDILSRLQDRYRYICVDEAQDTSRIQHALIRLLARKYGNLFLVGDEDQSIYGFRAACPEALLHFRRDYPHAKVLLMEENYRSTREIVSAANGFVSRNGFRYDKTIRPTRGSGKAVQIIYTANRIGQHRFLYELGKSCTRDTAILYRNNDSALPLIDLFERHGIPYNCKMTEEAFFSHRIVADILDMLRFSGEPDREDLFMRIYYKFGVPISRTAAESACRKSRETGRNLLEELVRCPELTGYGREGAQKLGKLLPQLPGMKAEDALLQLWNDLNYSSYVTQNKLDSGKFDILRMLARQETTTESFLQRLENLRHIIQTHKNRPDNQLMLSTVHSSKGLEYERVYLLDMLDGILPAKPVSELKSEEEHRIYEEDRRVFYVAMTRAKEELYLFSCPDRKSQFVREIISGLPRAKRDQNDLFFPFSDNLTGKSYTHARRGRGTVLAQCEDLFLIRYQDDTQQLLTLEELARDRDRTLTYEAPSAVQAAAPPPVTNTQILPGTCVIHRKFGRGEVLEVRSGIAAIQFEKRAEPIRILLDAALPTGILRTEIQF